MAFLSLFIIPQLVAAFASHIPLRSGRHGFAFGADSVTRLCISLKILFASRNVTFGHCV